jgi:SAM-dependent methyltransferase
MGKPPWMSVSNGFRHDSHTDHPCQPLYAPGEVVRGILSTVPPGRGYRVLIVGCCTDQPSVRLAQETGADVVSVEVHPPDPALPVGECSFDQVWCLGATTHVEDLPRFTQEVVRVLRPGGRALVVDTYWDGFRPPRFANQAGRPWHAVATKSVFSLLSRSGLIDVEVLPWLSPMAPEAMNGAGNALAEDLADGRLSPGLVLARKP